MNWRSAFSYVFGLAALLVAVSTGHHNAFAARSTGKVVAFQTSVPYPIQHVFVIIQENRSVDNLWNGYCAPSGQCADTVTTDPYQSIPLTSVSLAANYDLCHAHSCFVSSYDNGRMDGFPTGGNTSYGFVPTAERTIYTALANQGVLIDEAFQMNQGPSWPSHQYLIAGQSGGAVSYAMLPGLGPGRLALAENTGAGNCGDAATTLNFMPMTMPFPGTETNTVNPPCLEYPTIFDRLLAAGFSAASWSYYARSSDDLWDAPPTVSHIWNSASMMANVIVPSEAILTAIPGYSACTTPGAFTPRIIYVTPEKKDSDHPSEVNTATDGPAWVGSILNKIGACPGLWNTSAVIVLWDDWGGWYDHEQPPVNYFNPYEGGFRTPIMILSPYAKAGTIDHTIRTTGAILHFIEDIFGLQTLGTMDTQTDDLMTDFNMSASPLPTYSPVPIPSGFTP